MDAINRAEGEAEAILARADAVAASLEKISATLVTEGGQKAAALRVAEQYVQVKRGVCNSKLASAGSNFSFSI